MRRKKKIGLSLPCQYTDLELAEKRDELSTAIIRGGEVEERKASAARSFKEELDGLYARASELSYQIKKRSETRLVDCIVELDSPNVGEKTTIRLDTGEMVKVEVMTDEERQEEMDFGVEENRIVEGLLNDATPPPDDMQPPEASQ